MTEVLKKIFSKQNLLILVIFILFVNLLYLDFIIYQNGGIKTEVKNVYSPSSYSEIPTPTQAIPLLTQPPSPTPFSVKTPSFVAPTLSIPKEYYIPFGAGSLNSLDWQDVPGLQAYIDSTAYQNIKQVIFEVALHIPTGNETVSVRLVNATDGRALAGSELDFNGNTNSILLGSQPITLDYGNKLYKIQMKTQLNYPAILDQSRLHITTK